MDIGSICDKNRCDWGLCLMIILGIFVFIFKLAMFYWKSMLKCQFCAPFLGEESIVVSACVIFERTH